MKINTSITGANFNNNSFFVKDNFLVNKSPLASKNLNNFNNLAFDKVKKSSIQGGLMDFIEDDYIVRKIALGESLTPEEVEKLEKIDPEKLRKAKMANERRKELRQKLKNAKDPEEAKSLITSAKSEVLAALDLNDEVYSNLLAEAIRKEESEYLKNKSVKDIEEKGLNVDISI